MKRKIIPSCPYRTNDGILTDLNRIAYSSEIEISRKGATSIRGTLKIDALMCA